MLADFYSEHRAQKMRIESGSGEIKVKKRKRYKKMVTKMFTNDEGEMGEVSITTSFFSQKQEWYIVGVYYCVVVVLYLSCTGSWVAFKHKASLVVCFKCTIQMNHNRPIV